MLEVSDNLYIYPVMSEQLYIFTSQSYIAPTRPFAPRRRP